MALWRVTSCVRPPSGGSSRRSACPYTPQHRAPWWGQHLRGTLSPRAGCPCDAVFARGPRTPGHRLAPKDENASPPPCHPGSVSTATRSRSRGVKQAVEPGKSKNSGRSPGSWARAARPEQLSGTALIFRRRLCTFWIGSPCGGFAVLRDSKGVLSFPSPSFVLEDPGDCRCAQACPPDPQTPLCPPGEALAGLSPRGTGSGL